MVALVPRKNWLLNSSPQIGSEGKRSPAPKTHTQLLIAVLVTLGSEASPSSLLPRADLTSNVTLNLAITVSCKNADPNARAKTQRRHTRRFLLSCYIIPVSM